MKDSATKGWPNPRIARTPIRPTRFASAMLAMNGSESSAVETSEEKRLRMRPASRSRHQEIWTFKGSGLQAGGQSKLAMHILAV